MPRVKITEDFVDDAFDDLDEGLDWVRSHGVEVTLVTASNPGNGWPTIEISGERDAVVALLKRSWNASDADLEGRLLSA